MSNETLLFDSMRMNIDRAQKHFKAGNFGLSDYYLSLLSRNTESVRKMYGRKSSEPAESSDVS